MKHLWEEWREPKKDALFELGHELAANERGECHGED